MPFPKYGNNFGLTLAVSNKLRHVIAHYMVAVWYKVWSRMAQCLTSQSLWDIPPKSLAYLPKVFRNTCQRLSHTNVYTTELEGLYHRRLRFIPQPFIESVADVHSYPCDLRPVSTIVSTQNHGTFDA